MGSQQQATIRFKVEGMEVASKSFEQLARQATAQAVNMEKYTGQGRKDKALAEEKRLAATLNETSQKATMSQHDYAIKKLDERTEYRLNKANGVADAEDAIMLSYEAQRKVIEDNQQKRYQQEAGIRNAAEAKNDNLIQKEGKTRAQGFAEYEQRTQRQGRMVSAAYAMDDNLIQKQGKTHSAAMTEDEKRTDKKISKDLWWNEQKDIATQREGKTVFAAWAMKAKLENKVMSDEEKNYVRVQMAKIKAVETRESAEQKAVEKKQAAYGSWYKKQVDIENKPEKEPGGDKPEKEPGGGGRMGGALSGFGGKMLLGHAAGIAAGDIIGSRHGGQEIGSAIGGLMFGGPMVGAAIMGMELIGTAFKTHRENMEAAQKAGVDYQNTIVELSNTWSHMATGLVERNSFGKVMENEFKRASSAAEKYQQEADKQRFELRNGISFGEWWAKALLGDKPGSLTALGTTIEQQEQERKSKEAAKAYRNEEYPKQIEAQKKLYEMDKESLKTHLMRPGMLKEEKQLTEKIARQEFLRKESQRERGDLAAAGVNQATNELSDAQTKEKIAYKTYMYNTDNVAANKQLYEQAQKTTTLAEEKLKDAKEAKNLLPAQFKEETKSDAVNAAKDRADQIEKANLQLEAQTDKTEDAKIRATYRGFAQQEALRKEFFVRELRDNLYQSQAVIEQIVNRHKDINREVERENREHIESQIAGVHSPAGRAAAINVYQREMAEALAKGASPEEQTALKQKLLGIDQLLTQEKEEQVKLDYESYRLTAEEADIKLMEAASQFSGNAEVEGEFKKLAALREQQAVNADIRHYRMEGMQADIQNQERRHMISQRDADVERMILADRRAQDEHGKGPITDQIVALANAKQALRMADIYHVGQFSGAYAPGRVDFRALNQNRAYGALAGPGQFSGGYTSAANVAGLNKDFAAGGGSGQQQTTLLTEIKTLLAQIARNGGLN